MKRKRVKPEAVRVGNVKVAIYQRTRETPQGGTRTVYEVSDYTSGTRRLRSFADGTEARQEARRIATQLATGDAAAANMRGSDAASYGRATELLRASGASLELAAATFASCFETLGGNRMTEAANFYQRHGANSITPKPVAECVAELLATKENRGASVRYLADLRQRLSRFADAFVVDISSVTTSDVQHWLDGLKLAPQSAKNFRTVIGTLFQFAETRGYIFKGGNPVSDVERISANGGTVEIFTPDEIQKLLEAASPAFRPFVAIGAFAGLRTAEIQRLAWRDLDTASGFITVSADKAKTQARRLVPIQPNLAAWLEPYANRSGLLWQGTPNDLQDAELKTILFHAVEVGSDGERRPLREVGVNQLALIDHQRERILNAVGVAAPTQKQLSSVRRGGNRNSFADEVKIVARGDGDSAAAKGDNCQRGLVGADRCEDGRHRAVRIRHTEVERVHAAARGVAPHAKIIASQRYRRKTDDAAERINTAPGIQINETVARDGGAQRRPKYSADKLLSIHCDIGVRAGTGCVAKPLQECPSRSGYRSERSHRVAEIWPDRRVQ